MMAEEIPLFKKCGLGSWVIVGHGKNTKQSSLAKISYSKCIFCLKCIIYQINTVKPQTI